jgi:hypothetical protein
MRTNFRFENFLNFCLKALSLEQTMTETKTIKKSEAKNEAKNNNEYDAKFNELINVYEKKITDMLNEAKSSGELVARPLLNQSALRINLLATPDRVVLFSIAKLSQGKAIVLTYDDMVTLLTWVQQHTIHLRALLVVARKYFVEKPKIRVKESLIEE